MAGDTVSNVGSGSWSQQGNHNMNLSMRLSDMDDSKSDHTSEIKPYISFSGGSESSCRSAVDMNAMNQSLALVFNDQMSIPSQSPSEETQSAGEYLTFLSGHTSIGNCLSFSLPFSPSLTGKICLFALSSNVHRIFIPEKKHAPTLTDRELYA